MRQKLTFNGFLIKVLSDHGIQITAIAKLFVLSMSGGDGSLKVRLSCSCYSLTRRALSCCDHLLRINQHVLNRVWILLSHFKTF